MKPKFRSATNSLFIPGYAAAVLYSVTGSLFGQLSISDTSSSYTIDFSTTVSGVGNGTFNGSGFQSTPGSGQLDSDAWAVTGMSDGALAFGGTRTTASTDYTRGNTFSTTGGIFGLTASGNTWLAIRPGGDDLTPGSLTLRVQNTSADTITGFNFGYDIRVLNDQGRSNFFNFSWSVDDSSYTSIGALDYTSPTTAAGSPAWTSIARSTTFSSLSLANNSYIYLRWTGDDVGGSGSRDGFGLDNITLNTFAMLAAAGNFWVGADATRGGAGTWTATGGSAWATTNADVAGGAFDSSTKAIFGGTVGTSEVTVDGTVNAAAGIDFTTGGYTLSGGTINLTGADAAANTITVASAAITTISSAITADNSLSKAGAGTLVFTGSATGGTTISAGTLQLGDGNTTGSISGAITNNSALSIFRSDDFTFGNTVSGSGALTKLGSNTVTVSGGNSYAGSTSISAGVLRASNATALGNTTGGTTVASGAALELTGTITIGAEPLSLSGTGISSGGALRNISGDNTYGGTITLAAPSSITSDSGNLTLAAITGSGQNLTFGGSGNISAGGNINTGGTLTKEGSGTATLNGTLAGSLAVTGGTVALGSADRIGNSSTVSISSGTLGMGTFNDTVGSFTITGGELGGTTGTLTAAAYALQGGTVNARLGAGAITVSSGSTSLGSAGRLTGTATLAVNSGQLNLGGAETIGAYTQSGGTLAGSGTLTATSYGLSGGTTSVGFAGSGAVTAASGTTNLNGNSTGFTGATTVSGGTLALGDNAALGNSAIAISSGSVLGGDGITTSNAITIGTAASTANNPFTIVFNFGTSSGNASASSSNANGFTVGSVGRGNNFGTTTLLDNGSASNNSGSSGQFNAGAATQNGALNTGTSTYFDIALTRTLASSVSLDDMIFGSRSTGTGPTQYSIRSTGDLATSLAAGSLPGTTWTAVNSNLTDSSIAAEGTTFRIYGFNGSGAVGSTAVWRIDDLTLTGTSTTNVAASGTGTLGIDTAGNTTYSGLITVNNTATLTAATDGTASFTNTISGPGSITKTGAGTVILSGNNTYTGATTVTDGMLKVDGSVTSDVTVATGATLAGSGTMGGNVTIQGNGRHGAGAIGAVGTQTISDDLTYNSSSIFAWDVTNASTYDKVLGAATKTLDGSGAVFNIKSGTAYGDVFWDTHRDWTEIYSGFGTSTNWNTIFTSITGDFITWNAGLNRGEVGSVGPGGTGGYFTLTSSSLSWTAVPEPSSALAGLLIAAGLLRRRRVA